MSASNASRSVEVFVVDTPRAANVALGVVRADAESTHVLCRHDDESTPDFTRRVLRRIQRIQRSRRVRSLWYVVGSEAASGRCSVPLLQALLPLLESGSSLTVVGPGSHQSAVFEWIDSIIQRRANVTVRAQLYADSAELPLRVPAQATSSHAKLAGAPRSVQPAGLDPLAARSSWFPIDGSHGATGTPHAL